MSERPGMLLGCCVALVFDGLVAASVRLLDNDLGGCAIEAYYLVTLV